jgi:hypothetical protein
MAAASSRPVSRSCAAAVQKSRSPRSERTSCTKCPASRYASSTVVTSRSWPVLIRYLPRPGWRARVAGLGGGPGGDDAPLGVRQRHHPGDLVEFAKGLAGQDGDGAAVDESASLAPTPGERPARRSGECLSGAGSPRRSAGTRKSPRWRRSCRCCICTRCRRGLCSASARLSYETLTCTWS